MNKSDFKVGQTVYIRIIPGSNAARSQSDKDPLKWVFAGKVKSVGKRYVTVEDGFSDIRFDASNDFKHENLEYEVFLTEEAALDKVKAVSVGLDISQKLSKLVSWRNTDISYTDLMAISKILDKYEKKNLLGGYV